MDDKYTDKQVCDILSNNHFSNLLQYVLHMFGTMPRSMTEEEIIQYLKMNKNIGIVFKFMPEEVKNWIFKIPNDSKLCYLTPDGKWEHFSEVSNSVANYGDIVFTLSDNYEAKKESKGEWDEYDIKDGQFYEETRGLFYTWHEWSKCMSDNPRFTAFGGWRYADSNTWFMTPRLKIILNNSISYKDSDAVGNYCTTPSAVKCKPAIPVKIRFWKGETK